MRTLKEYRQDRYMTMQEFAAWLGVAADTLYRIQKGEEARVSTKRKIAKKLKVDPSQIAEFAPRVEP